MRKPTNTRVSQTAAEHGYYATDYSFQPDEWVYAPEAGEIIGVNLNAGDCGKQIILSSGKTQYYMCHFQDVAVRSGQRVTEGQKLGIMGETGRAQGRHLHIYIIHNGVRVPDPDAWFNQRITEDPVNKIDAEAVRLAYQLDGRTADQAAQTLHSTKGNAVSLLKGLIADSAKHGDKKTINDQKAQIITLSQKVKVADKTLAEMKSKLNALNSLLASQGVSNEQMQTELENLRLELTRAQELSEQLSEQNKELSEDNEELTRFSLKRLIQLIVGLFKGDKNE